MPWTHLRSRTWKRRSASWVGQCCSRCQFSAALWSLGWQCCGWNQSLGSPSPSCKLSLQMDASWPPNEEEQKSTIHSIQVRTRHLCTPSSLHMPQSARCMFQRRVPNLCIIECCEKKARKGQKWCQGRSLHHHGTEPITARGTCASAFHWHTPWLHLISIWPGAPLWGVWLEALSAPATTDPLAANTRDWIHDACDLPTALQRFPSRLEEGSPAFIWRNQSQENRT